MTEEKDIYTILEEGLKADLADFEDERDDELEDDDGLDLDLDLDLDDDEDDDDDDDDDEDDEDEDDDFDGDEIVINDIDDEDDDDEDYEDDDEADEDAPSPAVSNEEDAKFKDLYMRKCADLENFKKRAEKERRDILRFGNEGLIREVLTVVDNLERAIEHLDIDEEDVEQATDSPAESPIDSLREGVELTIKNMFAILSKYGVEEIKADGESFDPTKHEAISHEESEEHESGKVVKELQKGYFLKDRLLRPSLVIVAK